MSQIDCYKVLGVSREASADEIRKAYKKMVRENHPDMKPDDKQAAENPWFKRVLEHRRQFQKDMESWPQFRFPIGRR